MSRKPIPQGPGAFGFGKPYWERYYANPDIMDGMYNAAEHARYLESLFALEGFHVGSLLDLGFGLGRLLGAMIDVFLPHTVEGIEPSSHAFAQQEPAILQRMPSMEVSLYPIDLLSWCADRSRDGVVFDLGLCTSVFQYLSDDEIQTCVPILSQRVQYLYFTVPIDVELAYQTENMDFDDVYARPRSRADYHRLLAPGFTVVSSRVLESKTHFDEDNSYFNELLYRYG